MAYIPEVPESEADGALKDAYARIIDERGAVANMWKAQSLHPEALRANLDLYLALDYGQRVLSRREREMIGLVVASITKCHYAATHHADALGRYVSEPGLVPLLVADYHKAPVSARERAILDYTSKITKEPGAMSADDVETLRLAGLSNPEVLDVNLLASYFNMAMRVALGLGVTPEDADKEYKY